MTDQEINIAIAEACGWTRYFPSSESVSRGYPRYPYWIEPRASKTFADNFRSGYLPSPPDYTTDLNAMHEAEKMLSDEDYFNYCRMALPKAQQSEIAQGRTATARQRAEAFLRTLGKWKD